MMDSPAVSVTPKKKTLRVTGFEEFGGYMQAKEQKLHEQNQLQADEFRKANSMDGEAAKNLLFFTGTKIHINGYTKPSSDVLRQMIVCRGGKYVHFFQKTKVTHMVAMNLPFSKVKSVANTVKVVHPNWILDCVAAGRLLQSTPYLLFDDDGEKRTDVHRRFTSPVPSSSSENLLFSVDLAKSEEPETSGVDKIKPGVNFRDETNGNFHPDQVSKEALVDPQPEDQFPEDQLSLLISDSLFKDSQEKLEHGGVSAEPSHKNEDNSQKITVPKNIMTSASSSRVAKAGDKNFLKEFYGKSRLHHISMWGAQFKQLVKAFQQKPPDNRIDWNAFRPDADDGFLILNHRCKPNCWESTVSTKVVLHIDMDCFFVSVSLLKHPELKGQPVAVTHSRGSGPISEEEKSSSVTSKGDVLKSYAEIASCSYEARARGVKNGMFMKNAVVLCPELKTIPYYFEDYHQTATVLYNTVARYSTVIQAVSCDECFVDIWECAQKTRLTPCHIASLIANEVYQKTNCHASVGVSSNLLLARLATMSAKPNGVFSIDAENQQTLTKHLGQLGVMDLPGVGFSCASQLESLGIKTVADLRFRELADLKSFLGAKTGEMLFNYSRGIDNRELNSVVKRKSVSAEINYGIRLSNFEEASNFIEELVHEVHRRLLECEMVAKNVCLKLKIRVPEQPKESRKFMGHGICDTINKSKNFLSYTNRIEIIKREISQIVKNIKFDPTDLRGVGITLSKLVDDSDGKSPSKYGNISRMFSKSANVSKCRKELQFDAFQKEDSNRKSTALTERSNDSTATSKTISSKRWDSLASTSKTLWSRAAQRSEVYVSPTESENPEFSSSPPAREDIPMEVEESIEEADDCIEPVQKSPDINTRLMKLQKTRTRKRGHGRSESGSNVAPEVKKSVWSVGGGVATEPCVDRKRFPEFGGATNIAEACKIIHIWVSDPKTELTDLDSELLVNFCDELVSLNKLYELTLFLRCLRRHVCERNSSKWSELFNQVFSSANSFVSSQLQLCLKI